MASQRDQAAPGGHYSGSNKIPTVKEFIDKLDITKKERDSKLDRSEGQKDTKENLKPGQNQKSVTDPVTGKNVVIENATKSMVNEVQNPTVSSNLTFSFSFRELTATVVVCAKCKFGKGNGKSCTYAR